MTEVIIRREVADRRTGVLELGVLQPAPEEIRDVAKNGVPEEPVRAPGGETPKLVTHAGAPARRDARVDRFPPQDWILAQLAQRSVRVAQFRMDP
jgi:hypothetical protein